MRTIGNPSNGRQIASLAAGRVEFSRLHEPLIDRFLASIGPEAIVGDFGASSRGNLSRIKEKAARVEVLDINRFSEQVDILLDLCGEIPDEFKGRYDALYCSSVLEHVYDPFRAASNLLSLLKPGGMVMGSAPWLFPYHPSDGVYEDFWRFSPTAYGVLFAGASKIVVSPTRGRLATALVVLSLRFKTDFEKRFPVLGERFSRILRGGRHEFQTSGFEFEIRK